MSSGYKTYEEAYDVAQAASNSDGYDRGLEYNKFSKEYVVFGLPAKKYRQGHEVRCQVVQCMYLDKCRPGHGPLAEDK